MPMVFPTSPTVGQVFSSGGRSWVWTGETWDSPSSATAALSGLTLIKSQTIGTAVTSLTVTDAFSATYDNYKIVMSASVGVTQNALRLSYNNSTGSTYSHVGHYQSFANSTLVPEIGSGLTSTWVATINDGQTSFVAEILNPFLPIATFSIAHGIGAQYGVIRYGRDTASVSNTGFTVTPASGSLTGGTIAVYGYRK